MADFAGERQKVYIFAMRPMPPGRMLKCQSSHGPDVPFRFPGELITSSTDNQFLVCVSPARREEFDHLLRERGVVRHFELQVERKDGTKVWLWTNAQAVREGKIGYERIW
jgi:hypothetical protein